MEKLANITQEDINNGVLIRMLQKAGIPDVQAYVKNFHEKTEELIVEDFEQSDLNKVSSDEQIVPPADIQSWITGLRPRFDDSVPSSTIKEPVNTNQTEQQQKLPGDVNSWIKGFGPSFNESVQTSIPTKDDKTPLPPPPPTDLQSWMKRQVPDELHPKLEHPIIDTTDSNEITAREGNLGTWLNDWSKSLTEQPPPTSIDTWLKGLIPDNMHLPLGKANNAKGRLNSYLNAAERVLSQHGYNVSDETKPSTNVPTKVGMFGNVKQMYFLWKTLDKNNDRKITVEDVQIMLQEMGLGFLSKYVAQTLFEMVDSNHDGSLQFRDFIALMGIIKQLISAVGSVKA